MKLLTSQEPLNSLLFFWLNEIMQDKKSNKTGFTLIEILVVCVLMAILAGSILTVQYLISQVQTDVFKQLVGVDEANRNISSLVRELRNTRTGENGAYPLEATLNQEIIFYSDIDKDNSVEKVRYFLSGNQLNKSVIEAQGVPATYPTENAKTKVVAENIRNAETPIFYYYNGNWPTDTVNNPLDTPSRLSDTKLMKVYLEINPDENTPEKNFILESNVQIRNLKNNLGE